jgi:indolepyruvate ferredoxin oxidoreductase alpha subunit
MNLGTVKREKSEHMEVTGDCIGCGVCVEDFECPAIRMDSGSGMAVIDSNLCFQCGVCVQVCPQSAIKKQSAVSSQRSA